MINHPTFKTLIGFASKAKKKCVKAGLLLILMGLTNAQANQSTTDDSSLYAAHWVSLNLILVPANSFDTSVKSQVSLKALGSDNLIIESNSEYSLVAIKTPNNIKKRFPHLSEFQAYELPINENAAKQLIRTHLTLTGINPKGETLEFGLQIAGVIDQLFTSGKQDANEVTSYGATISAHEIQFSVWAPTARKMHLLSYDKSLKPLDKKPMTLSPATGVWRTNITKKNNQKYQSPQYYQYQIEVFHYASGKVETLIATDPYSLGLSTNSKHSLIVDLASPNTKPNKWDKHRSPNLSRPEAQIIYEAHIGDFSASDDRIPVQDRGKYKSFSYQNSAPMKHLKSLVNAGLNTFHILPAYDIGSINEDKPITLQSSIAQACEKIDNEADFCNDKYNVKIQAQQSLADLLNNIDPNSDTSKASAQSLIEAINDVDDYNWGYDPVHYTVPEGSYASTSHGIARIKEFRSMVKTLHNMGLRVVMDVVYNHTYKAALDDLSVLDKIVPGYYHRRNPLSGAIEQSTCCENTATEHAMMEKLMIDSLIVWTRDYKIDGFRFDLMGHQPKSAMLRARQAIHKIDPDNYFYGEGWNFGEVANDAQFVQATQNNLAGTSIGTFNDRLRDGVRGGSSFVNGTALREGQGLGNGQWVFPNELANLENKESYNDNLNLVRLGLIGNLQNYNLENTQGQTISGQQVPYGGGKAAYALDPADTINYVSKHDNQTLWDNNQYRMPFSMSTQQRVRLQAQGLSYPLYAQGIPFIHSGSELARSKSFLRDSYNYGHWFNRLDFSYQHNNYNIGLPPQSKDKDNWAIIEHVLKNNEGRDLVCPKDILTVSKMVQDMITIRSSSPLFSLASNQDILNRVNFLNDGPDQQDGLIVMTLDDGFSNSSNPDLDPNYSQIIVVFNHAPIAKEFDIASSDKLKLHPQQQASSDNIASQSKVLKNKISIPGFTTAVFVRTE